MVSRISSGWLLTSLVALVIASIVWALAAGSVALGWSQLAGILAGDTTLAGYDVVWRLRWPRVTTGLLVGGMLALAGAQMQVLLRNPLADPYILGVSGGAAVGALLALLLGGGRGVMAIMTAVGACVSVFIVFGLSHGRGSWSPTRLLLTGVVLAAGWGALISFMLAIGPDGTLRGMLFWLMGDLGYSEPSAWSVAILGVGLALSLWLARSLNLLAYGDLQAAALGVPVFRVRVILYFVGSLLTAAAVMLAGSVGFVGLVVPHALRLLGAGDHRVLFPAAVLLGGGFLVVADTLARTVLAPQQIPVGVVTAFIGVPVFLVLLYRGGRGV